MGMFIETSASCVALIAVPYEPQQSATRVGSFEEPHWLRRNQI